MAINRGRTWGAKNAEGFREHLPNPCETHPGFNVYSDGSSYCWTCDPDGRTCKQNERTGEPR